MRTLIIDLREGLGYFENYKLFKFPDNSLKFGLQYYDSVNKIKVITTLRTNDDIIVLGLVKQTLDFYHSKSTEIELYITYLMYQQDDRKESHTTSFGLKFLCNYINSMKWDKVRIYHPHSDKVDMIDNCVIQNNDKFLNHIFKTSKLDFKNMIWVIPDSGAFKTQFEQMNDFNHKEYIVCSKSRDSEGHITTIVHTEDLRGKDCFIVDDICLGGRTFIQIANELKRKNCGNLYLIVSHGIFNEGIDKIKEHFTGIYTTDSICTLDLVNIYKLKF